MAVLKVELPDDLLLKLQALGGRVDAAIGNAFDEASQQAEQELKVQATKALSREPENVKRQTRQMLESLTIERKSPLSIKVGFTGNRTNGDSNAMVANILEYGKSGQTAKPFVKRTYNKIKKQTIAAVTAAVEKEVADL